MQPHTIGGHDASGDGRVYEGMAECEGELRPCRGGCDESGFECRCQRIEQLLVTPIGRGCECGYIEARTENCRIGQGGDRRFGECAKPVADRFVESACGERLPGA